MYYKKAELYYNKHLLVIASELNVQGDVLMLKKCPTEQINVYQPVEITLFSPQGIQYAEGTVDFLVEDIQVNIKLSKQGEIIERRQHLKVPTELSAKLSYVVTPTDHPQFFIPAQEITIENISMGGVLFSTAVALSIGTKSSFAFYGTTPPIKLSFEIIRVEERNNLFYYGCKLASLAVREDSLLCSFIYQQQVVAQKQTQ